MLTHLEGLPIYLEGLITYSKGLVLISSRNFVSSTILYIILGILSQPIRLFLVQVFPRFITTAPTETHSQEQTDRRQFIKIKQFSSISIDQFCSTIIYIHSGVPSEKEPLQEYVLQCNLRGILIENPSQQKCSSNTPLLMVYYSWR